ncbi:putative ATP-dependent RNA helicase dhr2 [Rhodotorula mucilaginosa]|uniref:RNA helicase n=1 Tax=Rhodotorula mucilaginosa TaxID=5537 RepID=A0A9P7B594_RHOMI|nr:putative ATP-dependent RNA helicase dhr2 [Rhodotorula mucilaginosa]
MPRKLRFDEEGQAAPAAAPAPAATPPPAPPPLAVDDTASTSTASPSTTTAAGSKGKRTSGQLANGNGNGTPKKRKLVVFDEEAEEEAAKLRALGDAATTTNGTPKRRTLWNAEQKRKAKDEAIRLMPGRKALPVYAGEFQVDKAAGRLCGIRENDTVIVLAETGSGKTTQIPQFLLRSDTPCERPRVVCTQPRRVAAISLAQRVATEAGVPLGGLVGYTVRFDDRSSRATRLKYATDGALLAEMLSDRDLDAYDVVVLDEAHERSLRTDMLMGFLKDIQKRRKAKVAAYAKKGKQVEHEAEADGQREPTELKIVVMSATIDAKRFSEFFDNAPVLYISGRQHKVAVKYTSTPQDDFLDSALKTVFQIHAKYPPGSILVFLPGQEEIESLAASIRAYLPDLETTLPDKAQVTVLPLYAKLPAVEQAKAFVSPAPNERKIILSTNIAETSVTIPGVRFVVDCGLAKEKRYHAGTGIDSLVVESISQSSAKQRAGRAGRETDGWCFRLYTECAYEQMEKRSQPEIQRVSLSFALLHLLAAGQEDVFRFEYMDRPSKESIIGALLTLHGLEALDKQGRITPLGRKMAQLPLEPVYARVLLASFAEGCPREIIDLVSLLGSRDQLIINTASTREQATAARQKFIHRTGDHMMLLNILRAYEELDGKDERKAWCMDNFVSFKAIQSVLDARKQLRERVERLGLGDWEESVGDDAEPVLNALVGGLFANTALLQEDGSYRHTLTKQNVAIHPSSTLHNKKAPAIVYDELVLTTKTYARGVSSVPPKAIRQKAPSVFNSSRPLAGEE